jgi:regulator of protease activity HflC (stomatin/prohibitin superfamily)
MKPRYEKLLIFLLPIFTSCTVWPPYRVWEQKQDGEAELAKADSTRRIAVLEAQAILDSSSLKAKAEVERAKGVAEANKIIGDSLKNNESYLKYLWVTNMTNTNKETVYIPTEANIPILEAGKLK